MKNMKMKKLKPAVIIASALVIMVLLSVFLIARLKDDKQADAEALQTLQTSQTPQTPDNLQNYDFSDFEPTWGKVAFPGEYNKEKDVLVDYAYSDRYFDYDSSIYNPSLSTMSLCLELSSWASYETDVWEEKTRNARKLLDEIGFVDFAQNEFWSDSPSTESIGVVAAHKELADSTLIALPVRGGKYYNEWGSNVAVGVDGEHTGFAQGRDNVVKFLEKYIIDHNITGRVKIWLVGYSRGGAVANLVAGYLNENELPNGATLAFEDLYCYAFEPPQGALLEMADNDADYSNIHNIVNPNDIVPMVAPADWNFARYNTTSRLLPTVTTVEFENALAVMLEEYEEILAGVEIPDPDAAIYNVSEYAKRIDVNVNPLNFLPGGDPLIDIQIVDDTSQTMNEVLTRFITAFAGSLESREEYNSALEADLVHLLDLLMGYETGVEMDAVLAAVMEVMTANGGENLKYVLAPIFQLSADSVEERIEQVVDRLNEVLPQPEGFTDLYGTAATLIKAMGTLLVNHPEELLDVVLAFTNSKVMQSHYEEVTLAWVRAGDPNYTDTPFTMAVPETLRTVRVNCPVNVEIYDSEGNLVASMIDKTATTTNAVVGCAMNKDGEILIHLPADGEFVIVITAADGGEVNITLSEYNVAHSNVTRLQNYPDIPIQKGDVLTLAVPNLTETEYTDEEQRGSTTEYRLTDNTGKTIPCQREGRGDEIEYFTVSVGKNNACGTVTGGGRYLDGTFAQVEAQAVAGGSFIGWYINGEMVSADTVYRFAVDKDTALTAHFGEAEMYAVTFRTSGKGRVFNADHVYSAGSQVRLSAEAEEGYGFDHWETTAGTIENTYAAQTVLNVADGDAVITAVFRGKTCPACHRELTDRETHAAACGVEEHYTCDASSHQTLDCGHYACSNGNHGLLDCGHYACSNGNHGLLDCGHYACSNGNHGLLDCGHYSCERGDHTLVCPVSGCGRYLCDGHTHTDLCRSCNQPGAHQMACGHYNCDSAVSGMNHDKKVCGHYGCVAGDHTAAVCGADGHFACDNGNHTSVCTVSGCGRYLCDGHTHTDLCRSCNQPGAHQMACGHYNCDSAVSGMNHDKKVCGHYGCTAGDHTAAVCGIDGHYSCDRDSHSTTLICGHLACAAGSHGTAACGTDGHYACDSTDHGKAPCGTEGHYVCDSGDHTLYGDGVWDACGHYRCDASVADLDHSGYSSGCRHFLCDTTVTAMDHSYCNVCGYCVCSSELPEGIVHGTDAGSCYEWAFHTCKSCGENTGDNTAHYEPCYPFLGHYTCDSSTAGMDHSAYDCGLHYKCNASAASLDHTVCAVCGRKKCEDDSEHGEGICSAGT